MDGGNDHDMASPAKRHTTLVPVHIEVRVLQQATARFDTIRNAVHSYITSSFSHIYLPSTLQGWEDVPLLAQSVDRIVSSESTTSSSSVPIDDAALQIHVYQPNDSDAFEELASGSGRGDGEEVTAASVCELPSLGWEGLWESLIYAEDVKSKLLDYIYATVIFSDADVDFNIVSWNRLVLLHGPPGTGKTSLCRALAQKLSIRLSDRYPGARLLEINSHSLFSRWFSESGKLVQRLFSTVNDMVEDEETFVIVLIDEVESLTAARAGAMAGTEPSDALRVVNALLTQLDKLKRRKNVLVMATSNLPKAIDTAFVDRADIIQYIDLPPREAIYEILRTCLVELMSKGVVSNLEVPNFTQAQLYERTAGSTNFPGGVEPNLAAFADQSLTLTFSERPSQRNGDAHGDESRERAQHAALRLLILAQKCRAQGMSGRSLRRLPVLAQARHMGMLATLPPRSSSLRNGQSVREKHTPQVGAGAQVETWLDAMEHVVDAHATQKERLAQ
ncbi:P-loop containing nucleoside triphosphate hydrolase protein [Cristinia sonorae]|uniref:P-loop containing nucleoside triphosphate hydrolase protein n=1 Tax=Cristinia sonorae TaxID=1940300 RepID=A0A8K0UXF6_9AGAR|nr:P-loop containing nucleoside triphosphate hydrolase protein [Cristinia sonorae]